MAIVRDEEQAVWVCSHGTSECVEEFPVRGPEPRAAGCGGHGEALSKRCPNEGCPDPLYHPSDLNREFHRPCQAQIPWAAEKRSAADALLEYDFYQSAWVGRERPEPIKSEPPKSKQPKDQGEMPESQLWLERATSPSAPSPETKLGEKPLDEFGRRRRDVEIAVPLLTMAGTPPPPAWPVRLLRAVTAPMGQGTLDGIRLVAIGVVLAVVSVTYTVLASVMKTQFGWDLPAIDLREITGR